MNGFKSSKTPSVSSNNDIIQSGRLFPSNQIYYSITLLYTDCRKYLSDEIESFFELTRMKGFNIIKIADQREHQWLTSNQQEISVKEFPIFLIAREGYPTLVIP